jgi:DNA-binding response OmpR family regulator
VKNNSPCVQKKIQESVNKAILVVDRKHPGTVEYRGKTVRLTSKQFWLLAALAESPGKCIPYNAIYERVWGNDVMVEMQQISYHKAQLLKKIQKVAPKSEIQALITPVSGEGMVLNLRPEELRAGEIG